MSENKSKIETLPSLRETIAQSGLSADKKYGQNFLLDLNITRKIARLGGSLQDHHVIEIGPGPGGLTRALLESDATHVTAIEFDPRCIEALAPLNNVAQGRLTITHGDALKTDIMTIGQTPRAIIANLPYNIATPLLLKWLKHIYDDNGSISLMLLMFQKEVAERITATPNSKAYGRLAVIAQWLCNCHIAYMLPPEAFTPPPKVHSAVVQLTPKHAQNNAGIEFSVVERITAAAFGQRRKMVRQSLKPYVEYFEACDIDPQTRAENLTVEQYLNLARIVSKASA